MLEIMISIIFFIVIAFISANISGVLGPKKTNPEKETPFECGVPIIEKFKPLYTPRFFFIAIVFLIFDIEAAYLFPWALIFKTFKNKGELLLILGLFFIIIILAFVYVWKKGGLEWE
jgi:NADH-quinone oxidoreductase subunit A